MGLHSRRRRVGGSGGGGASERELGARVALLEAGEAATGELFSVPGLWGRQLTTKYDWDYTSEPEPHLAGRRNFLPRGKVLGGTSSMNAMIYVRGSRADYDEWAAAGARGWGYEDVLPYFRRAEDNVRGADAYHGVGGPLTISDRRVENPVVDAWVDAAVKAGHAPNADFNAETQEGVGYWQVSTRDGQRCSTAVAYLDPVSDRSNLDIFTGAQVTRLVIDGERVIGVEVDHRGEPRRLLAAREVVLSAGAYNTPQILLLSGIGPAAHLEEMGIPVVADLPVGDDLQDHPGVVMAIYTDGPSIRTIDSPENWERWHRDHSGPLSTNIIEAGGFFKTSPELAECDVQMVVQANVFREDGRGAATRDGFTVVIEVARPTSVGTVRLRSRFASAKPRILHNQLATAYDRETLAKGVALSAEIMRHDPIASHSRGPAIWPDGDAEIDRFVTDNTLGVFHPSSTCGIGRVVDPELRVLGVEGLRIADASVLPTTIRGNPNAICIAVGEKAADLIARRPAPAAEMLAGLPGMGTN